VAERNRLVKELRAAGRRDDAERLAKLRKPPKLVAAVNRAARELPMHAQAAGAAAEKLAHAQAAGERTRADEAHDTLNRAVASLADRAVSGGGDRAGALQLIRAAVASRETRAQLAAGQLREAPEAVGFDALFGMEITARRPAREARAADTPKPSARAERDARRRRELEQELEAAHEELREAERAEAAARRARDAAGRRVEAIQARLERLRATR
jgi:hypothetical protein